MRLFGFASNLFAIGVDFWMFDGEAPDIECSAHVSHYTNCVPKIFADTQYQQGDDEVGLHLFPAIFLVLEPAFLGFVQWIERDDGSKDHEKKVGKTKASQFVNNAIR